MRIVFTILSICVLSPHARAWYWEELGWKKCAQELKREQVVNLAKFSTLTELQEIQSTLRRETADSWDTIRQWKGDPLGVVLVTQPAMEALLVDIKHEGEKSSALAHNYNGLANLEAHKTEQPQLYAVQDAEVSDAQRLRNVASQVEAKRKTLRASIANNTARLQAAATDAEVQKLTGLIQADSEALDQTEGELTAALAQLDSNKTEQEAATKARAIAEGEASAQLYSHGMGSVSKTLVTPEIK